MNTRQWADGLGWFSIGLGLTEILAAKELGNALGVSNHALIRAFGVREVAAGVGILAARKKGPGVWARIAGDVLDIAVLGSAMGADNPKRANAAIAMAVVAPVVALDVLCGADLGVSE